jgi:hypothetical protein
MQDQLTEDPEMGAVFVDSIADGANTELQIIRGKLSGVIAGLESAGAPYHQAWRLLLAAEASIEHAVGRLSAAKAEHHRSWQAKQREAREFLVLRAEGSNRRFRVEREHNGEGKRFRNIPLAGMVFTLTFQRTSTFDGSQYGTLARLRTIPADPNLVGPFYDMTLQALHAAFVDGAIAEVTDDPRPAVSTPAPLGHLRFEEEGSHAGR